MTEDFDLIESTFVELHNALLDIGDLKKREFRESNFLNRLLDIFIAMLDFCLFSGKLFTEYRRKRMYPFSHWLLYYLKIWQGFIFMLSCMAETRKSWLAAKR